MTESVRVQRATVRDVAEMAGVSISTVSLSFRYPDRVAPETRQRIADAASNLSYTPRNRPPNGAKAKLFTLMMEELSLSAFPEAIYGAIIRGIETQARQQGMGMLLASVQKDRVPQSVQDNQTQGVIILGGCPDNDVLALELQTLGIPVVLVDTYLPHAPITSVVPDNEWGAFQAYEYLVNLGHRRIALIEGPAKYRTLADRRWGALRAAEVLGVPMAPEHQQPSISSGYPQKGYREMKQLLSLPNTPTAVFAVSDRAALGALEAIKDVGLRVPDDISLIGFDDLASAEFASPPLTSVHYAREQMGGMAFDALMMQIENPAQLAVRRVVPTELVVRSSTRSRHV